MKNQPLPMLPAVCLAGIVLTWPAWAIRPEAQPGPTMSLAGKAISPHPAAGPLLFGLDTAAAKARHRTNARMVRAYRRFVTGTSRRWLMRWDPATGTAAFGTGRPFKLRGADKLTSANLEQVCSSFVADNPDLFGLGPAQLRLAAKTDRAGRWFVTFSQQHDGLPVLGGQMTMILTHDARLTSFTSQVYPDVAVSTDPVVDANQAIQLAADDCVAVDGVDAVSKPQLCILPLARPRGFQYLLCWRLYVSQDDLNKKWQYLIDAATGRIVGKLNALIYNDSDITGTARLQYKPEFGSDPVQLGPFVNGDVTASEPQVVIAAWDFNTDPGWTTEGDWAFGVVGAAGPDYCPFPHSAYTGTNVYGYNLDGNYPDNLSAQHLTTTAIDCSGYDNVYLVFMRWLGVESSRWDHAAIEVSSDGVNWTQVWENPNSSICDGRWFRVSYDISDVAAQKSTVYIRWIMGPTDEYLTFAGWYIDDVMLVSYPHQKFQTTQTHSDGSFSVPAPSDYSVLTSQLQGPYCDVDYACGPNALFVRENIPPGRIVDFTWDNNWYSQFVESNVYRHVNFVHDYYAAIDPDLSAPSPGYPNGLDYSMRAVVGAGCLDGFCNAYWDGQKMVFGRGFEGYCDDFGLYAEVIYHEYTHAVTSKIYDGVSFPYMAQPGALNEAWSDYFACVLSPSQSPLVGDGGLLVQYPDGFRSLENSYRSEQDFRNEVHFDSQMLSAALWQARRTLSNQIDPDLFDQMVHFARYAHPQTFEQYLLALLAEDDARYGDGDPANATPHAREIHDAFGSHGIGGLQYIAPSIVIDDSTGNGNAKLEPGETVKLSVSLSNAWADAFAVRANLFSRDHFVKIKKHTATFDDVAYGGSTDNAADPFIVTLDDDCPPTHTINFELRITAKGPYNYARTSLFTYPVAVQQLAYDDGQVDDLYLGYGYPGGALAVQVTPEIYPCYISQVRLFPYPDTNATIAVTVWDDDGPQGLPGTILGQVNATITTGGDWVDVSLASAGIRIDSGSFYVGWIEQDDHFYNGTDMDPPYYGRSWVYFYWGTGGDWASFDDLAFLGNLMVRVRCSADLGDGPVENADTGRRYQTIQQAIDDAWPGEEIVVAAGLYRENIDLLDKNLTLRSTDPSNPDVVAATIISAAAPGPVVKFASAASRDSLLAGFTITAATTDRDRIGAVSCLNLNAEGPTIADCTITDNNCPAVYALNSDPVISNCRLASNRGDGIECRANSRPQLTNCIIAENTGTGILGGYPTITNCTIVANAGPGVFANAATITNSIIYNNTAPQIKGHALVTYSDVEGLWPGLGNIDADPCFADPDIGDYHLKSRGWRWNPRTAQWTWDDVTSRCIDAGNPGSPLADEPLTLDVDPLNRFGLNLRINMGAFGGTGQASMPPPGWAIRGDITNDGLLDLVDLALWTNYWLTAGPDLPADLDRNAAVNIIDFAFLAGQWLQHTPWSR